MKVLIICILIISLFIGITACTPEFKPPDITISNSNELDKKIVELQNQVDELKNQKDVDSQKITDLTSQIEKYQKEQERAILLENTSWIYPAKIEYRDFVVDAPFTYLIRIHNGNDQPTEFILTTEIYNNPDVYTAKTPNWISDWMYYQGTDNGKLTLQAKETKDVGATFTIPGDERFYSITGKDFKNLSLTNKQKEIMQKFTESICITKKQITASQWDNEITNLVNMGLIISDSRFEFITAYGENVGNIQSRNAIRWIISMK